MKLVDWRISQALSQQEAGAKMGVGQAQWSKWETGQRTPRFATIRQLAELTGGAVTVADFYPKTPVDPPPEAA